MEDTVIEDGMLKVLLGYTWPGIEYGEPPTPKHSFFEYIDAIRLGNISAFLEIERSCKEWWHVLMDRGRGAALHVAVAHGQFAAVRFLVEERGAEINQLERVRGWTPLHHCAFMAHHHEAPYQAIFHYLLQKGADASILTTQGWQDHITGRTGPPLSVLDVVVEQGRGWGPGELKEKLEGIIQQYADVPKRPSYTYTGPHIGPVAQKVLDAWERQKVVVPPANWRPPPPAGYLEAGGMRSAALQPWRPAGDDDGSHFMRPMTEFELAEQSRRVAEAAAT